MKQKKFLEKMCHTWKTGPSHSCPTYIFYVYTLYVYLHTFSFS